MVVRKANAVVDESLVEVGRAGSALEFMRRVHADDGKFNQIGAPPASSTRGAGGASDERQA